MTKLRHRLTSVGAACALFVLELNERTDAPRLGEDRDLLFVTRGTSHTDSEFLEFDAS